MTDDAALHRLLTWLSPAYPVGAFSYSHGLEYAVETDAVDDAPSLTAWVRTVLIDGSGRVDGILFREAFAATAAGDAPRLRETAELGHAFLGTSEFALEARAQGAAFLRTTREVWPAEYLDSLPDAAVYPVAVAAACAAHGITLTAGLQAYYSAMAANLVSAGVRLIPLGQTDGQRVVAALAAAVAESAFQAQHLAIDDIGSAAPALEIGSILHETQYTRLFRS